MAETIGARLERVPQPHGFDYLRIALSAGVVFLHALIFSVGNKSFGGSLAGHPVIPATQMIVPMFFALSGFLVAGSLERNRTLSGFLALRVLRIWPALAAEVLLSALILGPIVTQVSLPEYFSSPVFWKYFLNMLGEPQYHLPGVFTDRRNDIVNGSLWTLPWELACYLLLAGLALAGIKRRRWIGVAALAGLSALLLLAEVRAVAISPHALRGYGVMLAFVAGVVLYQYRDRVPRSAVLAVITPLLSYGIYAFNPASTIAVLPAAYFTVWLGLLNPPRTAIAGSADYSYGVYLFAYPFQQVLQTWPAFHSWYMNLAGGLACALLFAAGSWHWIEAPVQRRKKAALARVERWMVPIRVGVRGAARRFGIGSGLTEPPPPRQ